MLSRRDLLSSQSRRSGRMLETLITSTTHATIRTPKPSRGLHAGSSSWARRCGWKTAKRRCRWRRLCDLAMFETLPCRTLFSAAANQEIQELTALQTRPISTIAKTNGSSPLYQDWNDAAKTSPDGMFRCHDIEAAPPATAGAEPLQQTRALRHFSFDTWQRHGCQLQPANSQAMVACTEVYWRPLAAFCNDYSSLSQSSKRSRDCWRPIPLSPSDLLQSHPSGRNRHGCLQLWMAPIPPPSCPEPCFRKGGHRCRSRQG